MKISKCLEFFNIKNSDQRVAKYLVSDSRKMKPKAIFIAIDKGIEYINDLAIEPLLIISNVERPNVVYIPNLKEKIAEFAIYFYHLNKNHPQLIGIVGTNGKTSTANILHMLLKKSLLITTIQGLPDSVISENTTPNAIELINDLVYARRQKYNFVILEVSSIGIKEKRVEGLTFSYLIFLNLTKDHLDYHKTLEDYQNTKINFVLNSEAPAIVNANDKFGIKILKCKSNSVPFKFAKEIIIKHTLQGTVFKYDNRYVKTNLIGEFNMENLLSVLTLLKVMKKRIDYALISEIKPIKGRMDIINFAPNIVVDYAHTSKAFELALKELKSLITGRLIIIFGAGGDRDKSKRKIYGQLALKYGDEIILTNDNPRKENEVDIINDIHLVNEKKVTVILDRHLAIKEGIRRLKKEDTLAIIGKGHENYQIIGDKKYHFSDYEEVKKWL